MSGKKSLSIVIPTFNSNKSLRLCLESIKQSAISSQLRLQTIVVDNACLESCKILLRDFPGVDYLQEPKLGSYAARNTGIRFARGEWILLTDSDCQLTPNYWRELEKALSVSTDILVGNIVNETSKSPNLYEVYDSLFYLDQKSYFHDKSFGATAHLVVKKKVFEDIGLFDEDYYSGSDREFCHRAVHLGRKMVFADDLIIRHRARQSLQAILLKIRRVVGGERQTSLIVKEKKSLEYLSYFRERTQDLGLIQRSKVFCLHVALIVYKKVFRYLFRSGFMTIRENS
jgi:glycosyltransferase involved in cell wall biosynthesis